MRKTKWAVFNFISKFYWIYHKIHNWFIGFYKQKYDYKIFCIGDLKTGTTSLFKALKILGYKPCRMFEISYFNKELYKKNSYQGYISKIKRSNYDAFVDFPISFREVYKKIDEEIPNSKFILTIRDKEDFAKSYSNYFKHAYWSSTDEKSLKIRVDDFEKYNNERIEYFKNQPEKFLIFDVFSGDSWEKLCKFLDKPIPKKRFPHKNIGSYNKTNLKKNKKIRTK